MWAFVECPPPNFPNISTDSGIIYHLPNAFPSCIVQVRSLFVCLLPFLYQLDGERASPSHRDNGAAPPLTSSNVDSQGSSRSSSSATSPIQLSTLSLALAVWLLSILLLSRASGTMRPVML